MFKDCYKMDYTFLMDTVARYFGFDPSAVSGAEMYVTFKDTVSGILFVKGRKFKFDTETDSLEIIE